MKRIYFFIGTTAELIKLSPVIRELENRKVEFKIISSNQNKLNFQELHPYLEKSKPDYIFKMKPFIWPKNVYLRFIVWISKSVANYYIYFRYNFKKIKKDVIFIIHGDTITALVGAIVAKVCGVKLVHVESGLRSYDFLEPFPEEFSRFLISHLADVHFCPNVWSVGNLKNTRGVKINTLFNTVGESVAFALRSKSISGVTTLRKSKYFVLVLHRQEHTLFNKDTTEEIINLIENHVNNDLKCAFIMHRLTLDFLNKQGILAKIKKNPNIHLIKRLPYVQFIKLLNGAEFIATDGGSNQEEAYFLGKPCLILRNRTERIEGLGENAMLVKNTEDIINFINNYKKFKRRKIAIRKSPSKIIVDYITI